MPLLEKALKTFESHQQQLPQVAVSAQRKERMESDFKSAGFGISAEKFAFAALCASIAISFYASAVLCLIFSDIGIANAACVFLILAALCFLLLLRLPSHAALIARQQAEADLPMVARHAAIAISIKMPFEKVVEELGNAGYNSSKYFHDAQMRMAAGQGVQSALAAPAMALKSRQFTRFVSALSAAYEQGGDTTQLYLLADEFGLGLLAKIRDFGSKAVFTSLVFVACACMLPAFFMIYGTVAASLLQYGNGPGQSQIWAAFLLGFPSIDIAILWFLSSQTPPALQFRGSRAEKPLHGTGAWAQNKPETFLGIMPGSRELLAACVALAALFCLAGLFAWQFFIVAAFCASLPTILQSYCDFKKESRIKSVEEGLADCLSMAASVQKGANIEKIASAVAKFGTGSLAVEFEWVKRQIGAGIAPPAALSQMSQRTDSLLLKRAVALLLLGYRSGADMRLALRKAAEDLYSVFGLVRERQGATLVQKYTILAGAFFLVPFIIGVVVGMALVISGFSQQQAVEGGQQATLGQISQAAVAYIIIFAVIASVFAAQMEGDAKKAVLYAMAAVPVSMLVFALSSGFVFG